MKTQNIFNFIWNVPIFSFQIVSMLTLNLPMAQAAECIKLDISAGEQCKDLKVKADLAACGEELFGAPEMHCNGDKSEVIVRSLKNKYTIQLKKGGGAWNASWEIAGIQKKAFSASHTKHLKSLAHASTSHSSRKKHKEIAQAGTDSNRAPASSGTQAQVLAASNTLSPPPAASAVPPTGLQFSSYFDAYYLRNFNNPTPVTPPNSGNGAQGAMIPSPQNSLYFFNWFSNQLGLNLVELTIKHQRKETSFLLDLDFGQLADINAQIPVAATSGGPTSSTVDEVSKHIGQAIVTYTPEAVPGLVLEMGKMATHVGLEAIKPKDNWNYSRSVLFGFGTPFWHTGFHAGYAIIPSKVTASLYLYQGWNTIYENNSMPTYGAQLKWTPSDKITWLYNYIGGPEQPQNNTNLKQVHDTNVTYSPSSTLSIAGDLLSGTERGVTLTNGSITDAGWLGFEVLARWQVSPRYSLSPRFEHYNDFQGYTLGGDSQTLSTYTLTQSYQVSEGFETRLEFKYDHSSSSQRFITQNGAGTSADQSVLLLAFLYTM